MDLKYDIFQKASNDEPIWVEAVPTLEQAHERLLTLPRLGSSEYLVFDSRAGKFIDSLKNPD